MLETTLVAFQYIILDKVLDDAGRKILSSELSKILSSWTRSCLKLLMIFMLCFLTYYIVYSILFFTN
jgi:hypothetical protein